MDATVQDHESAKQTDAAITTEVRGKGRPSAATKKATSRAEHRLQVKLTEAGKARLDDLVERVGGETAAHVVRDALRIYDILTEEVLQNKGQLLIRDQDGDMMKLRLW